MPMRSALSVPELRGSTFDPLGTLGKAAAFKGMEARNALAEQELKDYPEKKQRETEEWEQKKKSNTILLENLVLDNFEKSLNKIDYSQYPQFREQMIQRGMDASYLPENFKTPDEFEKWADKALTSSADRREKLRQEFQEKQQQQGFEHTEKMQQMTQESAERRQAASEASAERRHQETIGAKSKDLKKVKRGDKIVWEEAENAIGQEVGEQETTTRPYLHPTAEKGADLIRDKMKSLRDEQKDITTPKARKDEISKELKDLEGEYNRTIGATTGESAQKAKGATGEPPDQQAKRLAAVHAALYKQGKDPMANPQIKATTQRFFRENPDMQNQFMKELQQLYPQGQYNIQQPQPNALIRQKMPLSPEQTYY